MGGMKRQFRYGVGRVGVPVVALCTAFTLAFAQTSAGQEEKTKAAAPVVGGFDKVKPLPPGGPAPRMADGHVDLTGRWYPNAAGRMLHFAYPARPSGIQAIRSQGDAGGAAFLQAWDGRKIQEASSLRKLRSGRYAEHDTRADTQHAPMELIQTPVRLVMLDEYPLDVRMIYMNGRVHPKDPDPTFNGDSAAIGREIRWSST